MAATKLSLMRGYKHDAYWEISRMKALYQCIPLQPCYLSALYIASIPLILPHSRLNLYLLPSETT